MISGKKKKIDAADRGKMIRVSQRVIFAPFWDRLTQIWEGLSTPAVPYVLTASWTRGSWLRGIGIEVRFGRQAYNIIPKV